MVLLYNDADTLGLDISDAILEKDHSGWSILTNDRFEIRRRETSGHFTFVDKTISDLKHFPEGEEPVTEEDLTNKSIDLLQSLDVPSDEIHDISVKRIIDQAEDEFGFDVGDRLTAAFLVYVDRVIANTPVEGSYAKLLFTTEGRLIKVSTRWRNVTGQAIDILPIIEEELLRNTALAVSAKSLLHGKVDVFYGGYAYVEEFGEDAVEQKTFDLHFVFRYATADSPLMSGVLNAVMESALAGGV